MLKQRLLLPLEYFRDKEIAGNSVLPEELLLSDQLNVDGIGRNLGK